MHHLKTSASVEKKDHPKPGFSIAISNISLIGHEIQKCEISLMLLLKLLKIVSHTKIIRKQVNGEN